MPPFPAVRTETRQMENSAPQTGPEPALRGQATGVFPQGVTAEVSRREMSLTTKRGLRSHLEGDRGQGHRDVLAGKGNDFPSERF